MLKLSIIKNIAFSAAIALAYVTTANAAVNGPYLGGQLGWGTTNYNNLKIGTSHYQSDGIAGRGFIGYQFDPSVAVELGYTRFHNATASYSDDTLSETGKIKEHSLDLLAVGIVPLQNGFSVNGKLGLSYITADATDSGTSTTDGITTESFSSSSTKHKIYPAVGAGVSYDITPNVPLELSWIHAQKIGSSDIKNTDLVSLGISYHFDM